MPAYVVWLVVKGTWRAMKSDGDLCLRSRPLTGDCARLARMKSAMHTPPIRYSRRISVAGIVVSLSLLPAAHANAQARNAAIGAGSQRCSVWVQSRSGSGLTQASITSWVQGFLVGHAAGETRELMAPEIADRVTKGTLPPDIRESDPQQQLLAIQRQKFGTSSGWVFDPPDASAIQTWLNQYCREHPLNTVWVASNQLLTEVSPPR
jgi:hypothetical protein